jgi:hypothetical protein
VFDPRIRNSSGEILDKKGEVWDGQTLEDCALFKGFNLKTIKKDYAENLGETFLPERKDLESGTMSYDWANVTSPVTTTLSDKDQLAVDYCVQWYGKNRPMGADDFQVGAASQLSMNWGGQPFMPHELSDGTKCFEKNDNGQIIFSDAFLELLEDNTTTLQVTWCSSLPPGNNGTNKHNYFYVSQFAGATLDNQVANSTQYNSFTIQSLKDAALLPSSSTRYDDYWLVPCKNQDNGVIFGGAYVNGVLKPIYDIVAGGDIPVGSRILLSNDQTAIWQDTVRLFMDQVNSEVSSRSSLLQTYLHLSQQDLNMASSLNKTVNRIYSETGANIR